MADFLDDLRPGIVVFVHPVAEAHEPELGFLSLAISMYFCRFRPSAMIISSMLMQASLAPPCHSPQSANARRRWPKTGSRCSTDHPHRRRAAILAVIGVQDQQQIQRIDEIRVHLVRSLGTANIMCKKFWQ